VGRSTIEVILFDRRQRCRAGVARNVFVRENDAILFKIDTRGGNAGASAVSSVRDADYIRLTGKYGRAFSRR